MMHRSEPVSTVGGQPPTCDMCDTPAHILCDTCAWDVYEAEKADRMLEWLHERGRT